MNSTMLRILATILAIGSVALGYVGYQLSQRESAGQEEQAGSSLPQSADAHPVVIAQKAIPAGHPITPEDLAWVSFPFRPDHTYGSPTDLIGKTPAVPIAAGEAPQERHFLPGSLLSRSVRPGERAIAVKVDEVVGSGGLVQPGDYVDVLLFLRASGKELPKSSAQIVLKHIKVLAYGDAIVGVSEKPAGDDAARATKERSAVLAVPLAQTSSLMLAASAGSLRLAVYGAEESQAVAAGTQPVPDSPRSVTLSELTQQRRNEPVRESTSAINIFHGSRKEVVEVK